LVDNFDLRSAFAAPPSGRTARSQGWASAVERLRPGWAGTTLTARAV